jgi:hypothetical protein
MGGENWFSWLGAKSLGMLTVQQAAEYHNVWCGATPHRATHGTRLSAKWGEMAFFMTRSSRCRLCVLARAYTNLPVGGGGI